MTEGRQTTVEPNVACRLLGHNYWLSPFALHGEIARCLRCGETKPETPSAREAT